MTTLQDWFCLNADRKNFKPQVWQDRSLIFCHEEDMHETILTSIEKRFAAGEPIKMMVYGDWGVGKTHSVNHIAWWLEENRDTYPAKAIIVELGDVTKKSKFDTLVRPFLNSIGLDELIKMVHAYSKATGDHVSDGLRKKGVLPDVADALEKFLLARVGDTPPQHVLSSFEYLKGGSPKNAGDIGLGPTLSSSEDFFSVLQAIGILYQAAHHRTPVFVCDEAAKLDEVDKDEASRQHWTAVNRLIFDDKNEDFGFIYTMSGKGEKNLARVITDNQILSRLGRSNLVELRNLEENDVQTFLNKLLDSFVDRDKVEALLASGDIPESEYDKEAYPFTKAAFSDFLGRTPSPTAPPP